MEDLYVEQIVEKEETKKDRVKKFIIVIIACAVSMVLSIPQLFGGPINASPLIIVVAIIANYFFKKLNIEYEYLYTNGVLDIDCIYNKSKRKNIFSAQVSEFIVMAHIDDTEHLSGYSALPIKDFSSGEVYGNTYMFITYYNKEKIKVIIEPNEKLLKGMLMYMTPKKLFVRK